MVVPRVCVSCGLPLSIRGRGRPQEICGECRRSRRRIKERATVSCLDCGAVVVPANHTGVLPKRCDQCRVAREKDLNTVKMARWRAAHPEQAKANARKYGKRRAADPAQRQVRRDGAIRRMYGLEPSDINRLLADQDHRCAICCGAHVGRGERLHVDHCHSTGMVRALLCSKCNTMLGLADDDAERLEAAAAYLRRHQKP